ncbi:cytochrome c [Aliiroseovarius sp. Z3]|uniref:c-type cytochrome n=1 Tax=Aliiroseovarius sp. Z3 TaxID=2811402 RepID=UPI0023B27015|nr:cytochrome c [Aliiroseovarius sp. Z3]MDE9450753.1 cytochrome c [Aliiroseovarius sp. Z3]
MIRFNRTVVYAGIALIVISLAGLSLWRLAPSQNREATGADDGTTPADTASSDQIVPVRMPVLEASQQIGQRVFTAKCAACHGPTAGGVDGVGPPLIHKIYEPSHHADIAFFRAAEQGVRAHHWKFGNMEPVEGITRAEVARVVDFIRVVQRENGIN